MADIRINALATTATTPASDDYLALDGTAQGTRKILATNIANNVTDVILGSSGPSVKSTLSARAPRQGLVFDGTAGATVANVPAFGTGDFTVVGFGFKTSLSRNEQIVGGATYSFGLIAKTDGTLVTDKEGIAANTASTGTFSAGKFTQFVYSKSGTNATYYINGVSAGTTTDNQNYTVAVTDIGNSTVNANSQWNGDLVVYIYNRALSSSEVVALYEAGAPAGSDYNSASNTSLITGDNSTFASDTGYWSKSGGTTIGSGSAVIAAGGYIVKTALLNANKKYRAVVVATAGGDVKLNFGGNDTLIGTGAGTYTYEFTAVGTTTAQFAVVSTAGCTVDTVTLFSIGLLLAPDAYQAGGGLSWTDMSGNGAQILLPTSGVSWNVPSTGTTRIRSYSYTNGNQQLFGASCVPVGYRIVSIAARLQAGGSPNVTLGSASGLSDYAASIAVTSTSWKYIPVASGGEITTTANIWASGTSTAVVLWDIIVQPLGV